MELQEQKSVILIVDDTGELVQKVTPLLEQYQVTTLPVQNGSEALGVLELERVESVIISDLVSDPSSIELLATIRNRWPGIQRVLYSQVESDEKIVAAVNYGGIHKMISRNDNPIYIRDQIIELLYDRPSFLGDEVTTEQPQLVTQSIRPISTYLRVLVIDDEERICRLFYRALTRKGYEVVTETEAKVALERFKETPFEVVVSDVSMPDMDGITVLKRVREIDLDTPVILVTGLPSMDSAVEAVEYGAFRYLAKPVHLDDLCKTVGQALQMRRLASVRRELSDTSGDTTKQIGDRAGLEVRFERALQELFMVYQPIVRWSDRSVFGLEALVRSSESSLPHPGALFDAAERLNRLPDIGAAIRGKTPLDFKSAPQGPLLFINLHPTDLLDEKIYCENTALGVIARRTVLEITERARLEQLKDSASRIAKLRQLGYRIALDDIGAGYAGLSSFVLLEPDIIKLDMALIRDLDQAPTKRRLIRSLMDVCRDFGMQVVSEGVETVDERNALLDLGCDLLQGYLFGYPDFPFPMPNLESEDSIY